MKKKERKIKYPEEIYATFYKDDGKIYVTDFEDGEKLYVYELRGVRTLKKTVTLE